MVPGAIFGYLSLRQVEEKFHQETMRRMRLQSREIGRSIIGGFSSIETEVEFLAGILGDGTTPTLRRSSDWGWLFHDRPLLGATRLRDGSRAESLFGNPCPPPPQTDAARSHLASNHGLLYLQRNAGGSPRFFLAHAIRGKAPERDLLVCEVKPDYLWERVRNAAPPVTEVAVLSPDGAPLFQTKPLPVAVLGRVERERRKGPAGNFEWGQGSGILLVDLATVFMKPSFLADDWIVVVSRPRSEAFAVAKGFTQVLFLSIALVVLMAGLFAHVLIRRSVAPLAVLKEGTRRISGGDFDSRVEIGSGDEFEDLARSFNAMADHLGREFRIQAELIEELAQNDLGTLTALARTVDTNSPWTAGHSERVTALAMDLGRELGLPPDEIDLLHRGGLLHDIGKIGVPPTILDKPGKLTEEEFAVIKRHPSKGAMILESIPNLQNIIPIVSQHHERFDGKGYPNGLSGESISLHARILAVADVVDALVSDRPYRPGWSREKVLEYTRENAGQQFDPEVVEAFFRIEARRSGNAPAQTEFTGRPLESTIRA
ncbi:MAG: HD-GYP domain-containing protein [Candidatus Deferrimicrobiaceae bacterium]